MNSTDHNIREYFKNEVDELLFQGLEFDDRMKNEILRHAMTNQMSSPRIERSKFDWRRLLLVSVAAAAIAVMILADDTFFGSPGEPAGGSRTLIDRVEHGANEGIGGTLNDPPTILKGEDLPGLLSATDGTTWLPATVEEAALSFGGGLMLPRAVPDGFELRQIRATGPENGTSDTLEFQYDKEGAGSFQWSAHKQEIAEPVNNDKQVDLNGTVGYIGPPDDDPDHQNTGIQLRWHVDGVQYKLRGNLLEDEALSFAEQFKAP
ncbi:hypothetical protein [Paenibacillus mendelii]|uniref:DUF4367 domain-containing protein n=1 Tax=Paenibacillus mendelii TaxID=206163 RepID=A0ABV6J6Z1_9BACL|nr:hypothetical protein [Paenibacillus mendelii]MCQ6560981.1 DUF4367 domain-containing protein [Paenibacillus mendelii]